MLQNKYIYTYIYTKLLNKHPGITIESLPLSAVQRAAWPMCTTRSVRLHLLRSNEMSRVARIGPFTYEASHHRVCVPVTQMFALANHLSSIECLA